MKTKITEEQITNVSEYGSWFLDAKERRRFVGDLLECTTGFEIDEMDVNKFLQACYELYIRGMHRGYEEGYIRGMYRGYEEGASRR